jgi:hypothetical protein
MKRARILLLYTDRYYLIKQIYPMGLDLIAHVLRSCGHEVCVHYPFLPEPDLGRNLSPIFEQIQPDLVGLGIRNLDTCMACEAYGDHRGDGYRTFFFLPDVKRIVEEIRKRAPALPLIAGGGAFTVSPRAILEYLDIDYGVVGEGEEPLSRFIDVYPNRDKLAGIPNLVYRQEGAYRSNPRQAYRFARSGRHVERDRAFNYAYENAGLPVQVKRGCNQRCSYCVEPIIEGNRYVFRDMDQIAAELKHVSERCPGVGTIFFVDTEFNLPDLDYPSRLLKKLMKEGLHDRFRFSTQLLPKPLDADFARLLAKAGFSIILTCDSFADEVLKRNGASYREADIIRALETCERYGIACTAAMIFGLPGETYETVDRTVDRMKRFPPGPLRRYEYTVGGRLYRGTPLSRMPEVEGSGLHLYGKPSRGFLRPYYYCAPDSPLRLKRYIEKALGYSVAYENFYDQDRFYALGISYLIDQARWQAARVRFTEASLAAKMTIYDYYFRKLTDAGRMEEAGEVSVESLNAMGGSREELQYRDQAAMIRFYLSRLGSRDLPTP